MSELILEHQNQELSFYCFIFGLVCLLDFAHVAMLSHEANKNKGI